MHLQAPLPIRLSPVLRYGLAAGLFLVAMALRVWVLPTDYERPLLVFYAATLFAFYFCGIQAGATVVAATIAQMDYVIHPVQWAAGFSSASAWHVAIFSVFTTVLGWLVGRLRAHSGELASALAALRESEQRYQSIVEDQADMVCRFQPDGTVLFANKAYCETLGLGREEVLGRSWYHTAIPDELPAIHGHLGRLTPERPVVTIENRILTGQREVRWIQFKDRGFFDASGQLREIQSVGRDITDLREAQQATERLLREQAVLFNNALIGAVKLQGRRIAWCNEAIGSIFGRNAADLVGQAWPFSRSEAAFEATRKAAREVLLQGRPYRNQVPMVNAAGQTVWVDLMGWYLSPGSAESIWLMTDITATKHAEDLQQESVRLEAENLKVLENSRLKSALLSSISRELRPPLRSMSQLVSLMQSGEVAPGSAEHHTLLAHIQQCSQQMLELLDGVFDLAEIESGRLELKVESVHLKDLVDEVLLATRHMLQQGEQAKSLHLNSEIDSALGVLMADRTRLKQVLNTFLSNAVRFTPHGGRITVRARPEGSRRFRIEVEDTGAGIEEKDLARLFSGPAASGGSGDYKRQGTGLSLMHAQRLVEAQGGTVGARSAKGVGSVFHLSLPLALRPGGADSAPAPL